MKTSIRKLKPCTVPGRASAEHGVVLLDGPDGVAVAMTPEAAALTAESLRNAAQLASAQVQSPPAADETP